jgi:dolichol-phosphate mannosyltransferase
MRNVNNNALIFAATYNEIDNIKDFIDEINKLDCKLDVLIIDDNSPDGTGNFIEKKAKSSDNLTLIRREKKLGLDTAHKFAYNYAIKNNYSYLITMDADLSHEPKEIIKILNHLKKTPFVIGSRYILGGKNYMKGWRLYLSIWGNKVIKKTLSMNGNEYTNAFRGFDLKKLHNFNLDLVKSRGFSFFMETIFELDQRNVPIYEIPITFNVRKHGVSKIPQIEIFRTLKNIFKLFLRKILKSKKNK